MTWKESAVYLSGCLPLKSGMKNHSIPSLKGGIEHALEDWQHPGCQPGAWHGPKNRLKTRPVLGLRLHLILARSLVKTGLALRSGEDDALAILRRTAKNQAGVLVADRTLGVHGWVGGDAIECHGCREGKKGKQCFHEWIRLVASKQRGYSTHGS